MQYRYAKFIATRYLQSAGERNVMFCLREGHILKKLLLVYFLFYSFSASANAKLNELHFFAAAHKYASEGITPFLVVCPKYPLKAKKKKIEGACYVNFTLKKGKYNYSPKNVKIGKCNVNGYFERSCTSIVKKWEFVSDNAVIDESKTYTSMCAYLLEET